MPKFVTRYAVIPANPGWWCVWKDDTSPDGAYWVPIIAWRIASDYDAQEEHQILAVAGPDNNGHAGWREVPAEHAAFVYDPGRTVAGDGPWPHASTESNEVPSE